MKKANTTNGLFAAALLSVAYMAQSVSAAPVTAPRLATTYSVWFARAMDPCVLANDGSAGPTVTVVDVAAHVPQYGCLQQNSTTDSTMTMNFVRLLINQQGRVGLLGTGLKPGEHVQLQLTLRDTRKVTRVKHPAGSNKSVTFTDVTVNCPSLAVTQIGAVVGVTSLATCLGVVQGEQAPGANVEILDAKLIHVESGKIFGVPGIAR